MSESIGNWQPARTGYSGTYHAIDPENGEDRLNYLHVRFEGGDGVAKRCLGKAKGTARGSMSRVNRAPRRNKITSLQAISCCGASCHYWTVTERNWRCAGPQTARSGQYWQRRSSE